MSLEDILQTISTGNSTEVDIWERLVHYFSEHWDGQTIFQQVKDLSRKQIGRDVDHIKDTTQYFRALENNFSDKNDLLEFIINLTGYLNFHTECGSVNVSKSLQHSRKILRTVRDACIRKGIFRDKNFVGREAEIEKVKHEIRNYKAKGILICGMGGMGKTSLASTICYELRSEDWNTTKIELREQRTFWHFLRTTMHSIKDLRGSMLGHTHTAMSSEKDDLYKENDDERIMKKKLIDYLIENKNRKRIYMFDNIDDVTGDKIEKDKMIEFFKTLLSMLSNCLDQSRSLLRIIVTSRENFLLTNGDELKQMMVDVEVKGLQRESAVDLVRKCTEYGQTPLPTEVIRSVVRFCGACPLAIRVLCGILNTSPSALIKIMEQNPESLSSSILQINHCLQQPYEQLGEYKHIICKLSLFGTAKFDLHSATTVIYGRKSREDIVKCQDELQLILLLFKSRHLLEIDNYNREESDDYDCDPVKTGGDSLTKIFSLHPNVYNFLKEKCNGTEIYKDMKQAKYNYLALFNDLVHDIGDAYDTNVLLAREQSEKSKVQIFKYIELLEELDVTLEELIPESALSYEQIRLLNKTILLIYDPEQHLSFLKKMCMKTEEGTITNCSWQVEYITALVGYETPCDDIEEKCDHIIAQLEKFGDDQSALIYKSRMLLNKGKIAMEIGDGRNSIDFFQKAIDILKSKCVSYKNEYQVYLAEIYNSIGCVYYRTTETEESMKWHKRALMINDKQKLKNESTLTFCANLGACHFRLGIEHNRNNEKSKMKAEMEKALDYYNESIIVSKLLKAETTDDFAKKLKNRGDVLAMLGRFKESENNYKLGLEIVQKLHSSRHIRVVLLQHAKGDLIRQQISHTQAKKRRGSFSYREDEEDKGDVMDMLSDGLEVYEKLIKDISVDILSSDHAFYNKIKKNHLYFLKQLNEQQKLDKAEIFYQKYESGNSPLSSVEDSSSSSLESTTDTEDAGNEISLKDNQIAIDYSDNCIMNKDGDKSFCEDDNPCCIEISTDSKEKDSKKSRYQKNNESTGQNKHNDFFDSEYPTSTLNKELPENQKTPEIEVKYNESSLSGTNEQKKNFKLPLTYASKSLQTNQESPCFGMPKKITTRRGSSSSSGISSLDSMTPDSDRISTLSIRLSREASHERSCDDDIFGIKPDMLVEQGGRSQKPHFIKRSASLRMFGSGSLEEEDDQSVPKKQKFEKRTPMVKSVSLDAIGTTTPKTEDWYLTDKLSSWFDNNTKTTQTDLGTLDNIADDIESLIPSVKSRMRTLLHELDTEKAKLTDDHKGRPIVQYIDEDFQDQKDINE